MEILYWNFFLVWQQRGTFLAKPDLASTIPFLCIYLFYRPDDRSEVWRFLSYMFVHVTVEHLILNITIQLLVGLPLEMSHSSWRVAIVYLCGVFAGSLASSTFDPEVLLAGICYVVLFEILKINKIF